MVYTGKEKLLYEGKYWTRTELAKYFSIGKSTIIRKIDSGMSLDEIHQWALDTYEKRKGGWKKKKQVTYTRYPEAICWQCANKDGLGCSWSHALVPVKGSIFDSRGRIAECPKFIKSKRKK